VVGGIALLDGRPYTVIATEKGKDTKDRIARNFGAPNPEGYRKALRLMRAGREIPPAGGLLWWILREPFAASARGARAGAGHC
jgi:hypothetical protein